MDKVKASLFWLVASFICMASLIYYAFNSTDKAGWVFAIILYFNFLLKDARRYAVMVLRYGRYL